MEVTRARRVAYCQYYAPTVGASRETDFFIPKDYSMTDFFKDRYSDCQVAQRTVRS
jgi:hypothetical protein